MAASAATTSSKAPLVKKATKKKKRHYYRMSVSAIPGKDEHIDFSDPTSRCLTVGMKALHAATVKKMDADIAAHPGNASVALTYKEKIGLVWSAMEQPYCGFGSRGLAAVTHSYEKSVERIRAEYLAGVK